MSQCLKIYCIVSLLLLFTITACGRNDESAYESNLNAHPTVFKESPTTLATIIVPTVTTMTTPMNPTLVAIQQTLIAERSQPKPTPVGTITSGGNGWFIPEPPPYSTMQQVQVSLDAEQRMRTTTFVTYDDPQKIFEFYKKILLAQSWRVDDLQDSNEEVAFYWLAPYDYPAFNLWITATVRGDTTKVVLVQQVSGPFPVVFPTPDTSLNVR